MVSVDEAARNFIERYRVFRKIEEQTRKVYSAEVAVAWDKRTTATEEAFSAMVRAKSELTRVSNKQESA